jgi:hypothetical protein
MGCILTGQPHEAYLDCNQRRRATWQIARIVVAKWIYLGTSACPDSRGSYLVHTAEELCDAVGRLQIRLLYWWLFCLRRSNLVMRLFWR